MDSIPATQHQGCIPQVQQIIANKQNAVDEIGKLHIIMEQSQDKNMAIAVKNEAHPYSNEISDKQVENVGYSVHTSDI